MDNIDDLIVKVPPDKKEHVFIRKETKVDTPVRNQVHSNTDEVETDPFEQDDIFNENKKDTKEITTVNIDDDETDNSNILFISDCSKPEFKLESFVSTVEYEKFLFANRTIEEIFEQCKYLWLNINNKDGRLWLQKNLKKCSYNISLVYSDKDQKWIKDVENYLTKIKCTCCSKISLNKLMKVNTFNEEQFVSDIMQTAITLSKPTFKIVNFLKGCLFSKGVKKKA